MLIQARDALDPELAALVAQQRGPAADHDDLEYLVAVVDGRVVGYAAWSPGAAGTAVIAGTYVRPAFRGRGITRNLLAAVDEFCLR